MIKKILSLIIFFNKSKSIAKNGKQTPYKFTLTEITAEEIEATRCKQYKYAV